MNDLKITTAHNVTLRIGYASIGDRLLAGIIDNLIKAGFILAVLFCAYQIHLNSNLVFWIIISIPFVFYSLFFEYFMNGQTPGKRVRDIRVMSESSEALSLGQCIIRWLFRLVDFNVMPGIGIVTIAVTLKKQRFGDMIAGTVVSNIKQDKTLEDTIYAHVAANRMVHYHQAGQLSPREIEIVKEVLRQYTIDGTYDLVPITANRVRTAIGADHDMDDLSMLKFIVEDYYILATQ